MNLVAQNLREKHNLPVTARINAYLSLICNERTKLTSAGYICYACYKLFNNIIKHSALTSDDDSDCSADTVNDNDGCECPAPITDTLDSVEAKLTLTVNDLYGKGDITSINEYLELIICGIGQVVLKAMQQNQVLLLYKQFCESALQRKSDFPSVKLSNESLPSIKWFDIQLHLIFEDNVLFECKHKKVGTMVLCRHCDILSVLSNTIGETVTAQRHAKASVEGITTHYEQELTAHTD